MHEYAHNAETLENGLRLLRLDLPRAHSVALHAFVPAGAIYETKLNNGVSHLLEHLHMSVTRSYSTRLELMRALDALAGSVQAETDHDVLTFTFSATPAHLGRASELLAEILEVRGYSHEILESERQLLLTELGSYREYEHPALKRLFPDHPFGLPPGGTRRSLKRLTAEQVEAFDRMSFAPDRLVVAVVGRLLPQQLEQTRAALSKLRAEGDGRLRLPSPPKLKLPLFRSAMSRSRQRNVVLGFLIDQGLEARERLALGFLQMGLTAVSSPLSQKLRYTSGSTYVFDVDHQRLGDVRLLYLYGLTRARDRDSFVREVLQELVDIRSGKAAAVWFDIVKEQYLYLVQRALDIPETVAERLGKDEIRNGPEQATTIPQELKTLEELTPHALAEITQRLLTRERFFLLCDELLRPFDITRLKRTVGPYL